MALESGTVSLKRFYPSKSLPERSHPSWLEKLNAFALKDVELEQDKENEGWSVLGNELSTDFNEQNVITGPYLTFAFRCDTHRVAMNIVDLHFKAQVELSKSHGELVNRQKENDIKEDIIQDLLARSLPNIDIAGVLVDTYRGIVYYTSSSDRMIDKFVNLFRDCFDITLYEVNYESAAARLLEDEPLAGQLANQPGLLLVDNLQLHPDFMDTPDSRLGSSFMTWFFFYLQTSESVWISEEIEEIFITVEDEMSLAGEAFGSKEVTIKKGEINNCKELIAAFSAGKRISRMKFIFYRGNDENSIAWSFSLDKKNYSLASLKVPKPEAVDTFGIKLERYDAIAEIHHILDDIFRDYLQFRTGKAWLDIEEDMKVWLQEISEINHMFIQSSIQNTTEKIEPQKEVSDYRSSSNEKQKKPNTFSDNNINKTKDLKENKNTPREDSIDTKEATEEDSINTITSPSYTISQEDLDEQNNHEDS